MGHLELCGTFAFHVGSGEAQLPVSGTDTGVEVTQWPKLAGRHQAGEQGQWEELMALFQQRQQAGLPVGLQSQLSLLSTVFIKSVTIYLPQSRSW